MLMFLKTESLLTTVLADKYSILPSVCDKLPEMTFRSVDFPDPLLPIIACGLPDSNSQFTALNTQSELYFFPIFSRVIFILTAKEMAFGVPYTTLGKRRAPNYAFGRPPYEFNDIPFFFRGRNFEFNSI